MTIVLRLVVKIQGLLNFQAMTGIRLENFSKATLSITVLQFNPGLYLMN